MHRAVVRLAVTAAVLPIVGCAGVTGANDPEDVATVADLGDLSAQDLAKSDLPAGTTCNPATQTLGAAGGPDVCPYGETCDDTTNTCKAVPSGTCPMVTGAPTWNKTEKLAPVITKATAALLATTNPTNECANGDPAALVTVDFYAPMSLTTTTLPNVFLGQVKFKKSQVESDPWYSGTFMRQMPPAGQKFGTFKVGINCGGAGGSVKTSGFYVVDEGGRTSNPICVTW